MTASNFDACMAEVFSHEGGYVNDPRDPGGETNMGISKRTYPSEDIRGMTRARAAAIYRRDFWNRVKGDQMPDGLDLVAFDPAVNSGVKRGSQWLQTGLGLAGKEVDGKIGPLTVAKAQTTPDGVAVIKRACAARMGFLRGLTSLWSTYSRGWTRRVASIEATAVAMNTRSKVAVRQERKAASGASKAQATSAAGTAAGGAGGLTVDGLPDLATYGLIALAVIVAVVLVSKSRVNKERAKAYSAQEAKA